MTESIVIIISSTTIDKIINLLRNLSNERASYKILNIKKIQKRSQEAVDVCIYVTLTPPKGMKMLRA